MKLFWCELCGRYYKRGVIRAGNEEAIQCVVCGSTVNHVTVTQLSLIDFEGIPYVKRVKGERRRSKKSKRPRYFTPMFPLFEAIPKRKNDDTG